MNCLSLQLNPKEPFCPNTGRTVLFFQYRDKHQRHAHTHYRKKNFLSSCSDLLSKYVDQRLSVDQLEVHGGVSAPSAIP